MAGWARNLEAPDVPVSVDILVDGNLLTTVVADEFRQDLLDAGKSDGRCSFNFPVGVRLRDGKTHSIHVRISGTDTFLPGTPKQINCPYDVTETLPRPIMNDVARVAISERSLAAVEKSSREKLQPFPMRVHIVCYEDLDDWILGKIARNLRQNLEQMGMTATVGKEPDPSAEINHHVIYWGYVDRKTTLETVMVTHIDNYRELGKVRQQLVDLDVEMGICMSFEAVHRLAHFGVPRQRLAFVNPAHDGMMKPRKIRVGITTRVYEDGCKREHLLQELSGLIRPDDFEFVIMGSGWEPIVDAVRGRGFEVDYAPRFDYEAYSRLIPALDYYLYTGLDEGSIGFLDAVSAGVATIVTPQGYHLDVEGGITHPFRDLNDLQRIFTGISEERMKRVRAVSGWSWSENARKHALIWNYLLRRRDGTSISKALDEELSELAVVTGQR